MGHVSNSTGTIESRPRSPKSKHGFSYPDSCECNDVGSVSCVASKPTKNVLFCNMVRNGGCASTFKRFPVRTALISLSALAERWLANLPGNLHVAHAQCHAAVRNCFPSARLVSTALRNLLFRLMKLSRQM